MLLDHLIMSVGIGIIGGILIGFSYLIGRDTAESQLPQWFILISIVIGFSLLSSYFNKDAIKGKSPAKRIFGLMVLNNKTNEIASPIKSFLRNITLFIWPIEVVFSLFSPQRRIGDFIAGTKVIKDDNSIQTELNIRTILFAWILGILFLCLLFFVQDSFF